MTINFRADRAHHARYDVVDCVTDEPLSSIYPIFVFYADDASGIFRFYVKDHRGGVLHDLDGKPAWGECRGRIKIVPRCME